MFKKKNKNLHRALIALMVLGLLVCLCFTLASAPPLSRTPRQPRRPPL